MEIIATKYFILLNILFASVLCENRSKYITKISPTIERNLGESAILTCDVDNPHDYVLVWTKRFPNEDQSVLASNRQLLIKDDRFNLTGTSNSSSLEIKNIEPSDAAVYTCQVIVSANYKEVASVELYIRSEPKITQYVVVTPSPASLNDSVELNCTAEGYPKISISWVRAGGGLLPIGTRFYNETTFKMNNVSAKYRGIYSCIADNGIGQPARRNVTFNVEFAPEIYTNRPKVAQALGYTTEIGCKVDGFPEPEVSWFKNGTQIHSKGTFTITNAFTLNAITYSVLRIDIVDKDHYGNFICKAANKLGSAERAVMLFETPVAVYPWEASRVY